MPDKPFIKAGDGGCVCGHGQYNHGGGYTLMGKILGQNSHCIRCNCMEFRWATKSDLMGRTDD